MMSDRLRLATTVAAAVTLAFGIALSMGWERPYWAGLAIVMIGLPTMSESVFKGLQRILGTLAAIPIAILFIDLFAQNRWGFAVSVGLWMAFCTWRMMTDSLHYYFWFCWGYMVPLLSVMSDFDSTQSFYVVATRAEETMLGVLCFIAVGLLLSYRSTYGVLSQLAVEHVALLRAKLADVRRVALGEARPEEVARRNAEIANRFNRIEALHTAALLESFALRERAPAWRQMLRGLRDVSRSLDRLDMTFDFSAGLPQALSSDTTLLQPLDEIDARLGAISDFITLGRETRAPITIDNPRPKPAVDANAFARGEALLRHDIIDELDRQTDSAYQAVADIADVRRLPKSSTGARTQQQWRSLIPNPEDLGSSLVMALTFWLAFAVYIFTPSLPDGPTVMILSAAFGANLARMPWIPAITLLLPATGGALFGGAMHVFVMPHLSGFAQFGTMLFAGTFVIAWLLHSEALQGGRFIASAMFLMTLQVTNSQTYSAMYVLNIVFVFAVLLLLFTFVHYWPVSFRPERVIERLLNRYGHSLLGVLSSMRWDDPAQNTWRARQLRAYRMDQLLTIPPRIDLWIGKLSEGAVTPEGREELYKLNDRLAVLSNRVSDLASLREGERDAVWVDALSEEVRAWRGGIQRVISEIVEKQAVEIPDVRQRLDTRLTRLETLIAQVAQSGAASAASDAGTAHMQRVLAAYRGVSAAVIGVAERTQRIDWRRLVESRF